MTVPENPKIFHIVHVDHLASIVHDGGLFSDAVMSQRADDFGTKIGMQHIKERRMQAPVGGPAGGMVGEYVPFYFCPRSIMLYIMHMSDHPDITYRGGQAPIIHLVTSFLPVRHQARTRVLLHALEYLFFAVSAGELVPRASRRGHSLAAG